MKKSKKQNINMYLTLLILSISIITASIPIINYSINVKFLGYIFLILGGVILVMTLRNKTKLRNLKLDFNNILNSNHQSVRVALHILFWFTYLMIHSTLMTLNFPDKSFLNLTFKTTVFYLPIDIIATYFTLYVLMPKFLYTRKLFLFIITFTLSAIPFIILTQTVTYFVYIPIFHPEYAYKKEFYEFSYFYYIVATYSIVILAGGIKLTKRWYETKDKQAELENQNLKSELAMLKLQISPHFLFNTLNNIDSLIYSNKEKASETIIKLSGIMRYMLYDSQHGKVELTKEIEYLENIVKLQSLRIAKDNFISLKITGDTNDKLISALLFVPFIENAIKHGDKNVDSPGISIKLDIKDNLLSFNIVNFVGTNQAKDEVGGIGLTNVKRRLELLYPNNYDIRITESDNIYSVDLILNL